MDSETRQAGDTTICVMNGVRGGELGFPVSVCKDKDTGRLMIRGVNEGGFACVDIDLLDLVEWLTRVTEGRINAAAVNAAVASREHHL